MRAYPQVLQWFPVQGAGSSLLEGLSRPGFRRGQPAMCGEHMCGHCAMTAACTVASSRTSRSLFSPNTYRAREGLSGGCRLGRGLLVHSVGHDMRSTIHFFRCFASHIIINCILQHKAGCRSHQLSQSRERNESLSDSSPTVMFSPLG